MSRIGRVGRRAQRRSGRPAAWSPPVILFATLLPAISYGNIVFVLTFPVAAAVVLKAVWAKGWVVPDEPDLPPLPVTDRRHPPLHR